jgi:Mor family transcriptional regulator
MAEVQKQNDVLMQFVMKFTANLYTERPATPEDIAALAAHTMQEEFGGDNVYINTGHFYYACERAKRIFKRWQAGVSYENLADEYKLTTRRIRQIVEDIRDANFKAKQGKLFE